MIGATMSMAEARAPVWDAIVVGAGPAGSVAALGMARQGLRVLLVDRSNFPRPKLCGACLNADSIDSLGKLGLADRFTKLEGVPLSRFRLHIADQSLSLPLPGGIAVTRSRFDAMLVEAAIEAGADFLPGVRLEVEAARPNDAVRCLRTANASGDDPPLRARSVTIATGLASNRRTSDPALDVVTRRASRIGTGTLAYDFPFDYTPGTIFMAVGRSGYVGLTRTNGNALNIAAALDRKAVRTLGPRLACEQILNKSGFPVTSEMLSGTWRGTMGLTRRRTTPASTRLFFVGDAAGYVEPFTGEGMAWAILGAQAVVPFVARSVVNWRAEIIDEWSRTSRHLIGRRQRGCRILSELLRYPAAVRGLVRIVTAMPSLGEAIIHRLNREHGDELLDPRHRHGSAA